MHYIVYDLEFNQVSPTYKKCPFEIIQIGAVKLDEHLQTLECFNRLIKPTIYTEMNPFISKLTSITMEQLIQEASFVDVFSSFQLFLETKDNVLCVWGTSDLKELFRNLIYHQLSPHTVPKQYINIQPYTAQYFNFPNKMLLSLKNAIDFLNISTNKSFHDALNDAYYTAEIFKKLSNSLQMTPELYNPDSLSRPILVRQKKKQVNWEELYSQFEKMYQRTLTNEERSIIKLSFLMGKTHQFEL